MCRSRPRAGGGAASGEINVPADLGLADTYTYAPPSIAMDASGNFIVGANLYQGQIARLFAANGAPLSPTVTLTNAALETTFGPGVGMDAQGDAEALYLGATTDTPGDGPVLLQQINGH